MNSNRLREAISEIAKKMVNPQKRSLIHSEFVNNQRIHYLFATQIVIGDEFLKMIMEVNKNSRKRYWKKIAFF